MPNGSISTGTLRSEDLIPVFAATLRELVGKTITSYEASIIKEAEGSLEELTPDEQDELVGILQDALDDRAPVGLYFGSHKGDGADFGFWPLADD